METLIVSWEPMEMSCEENPTELITRVLAVAGTVIRNVPSAPVEAPALVPLAETVAPWRGAPLSSVTLPVIVFVWEKADSVKSTHNSILLTLLASIR